MQSFPKFIDLKYGDFGEVLNFSLHIVNEIENKPLKNKYKITFYGSYQPESLKTLSDELKKIGIKMNLLDLSVKNNKIQTILELKPINRYLNFHQHDVSKSLEIRLNQKLGLDIKSDFFPPHFNVYYVFDNNRGKNLDKLRMIIYLFLEKNNFPKNINISDISLTLHQRLLFRDYHFCQIKKELSRRGIEFTFYKNFLSSPLN